jgi:hypothetical protein
MASIDSSVENRDLLKTIDLISEDIIRNSEEHPLVTIKNRIIKNNIYKNLDTQPYENYIDSKSYLFNDTFYVIKERQEDIIFNIPIKYIKIERDPTSGKEYVYFYVYKDLDLKELYDDHYHIIEKNRLDTLYVENDKFFKYLKDEPSGRRKYQKKRTHRRKHSKKSRRTRRHK